MIFQVSYSFFLKSIVSGGLYRFIEDLNIKNYEKVKQVNINQIENDLLNI